MAPKYQYIDDTTVQVTNDDGTITFGLASAVVPDGETILAISDEILAKQTAATKAETRYAEMLAGDTYTLNGTDYKVSFTSDDGNGVVQVYLSFTTGDITSTTLHFSNGTEMPVTSDNFTAFRTWFVQKRNTFFEN